MLAARHIQLSHARWWNRVLGQNETGRLDDELNLYMGIDEVRGGLCIRLVLYERIGDCLHKEALATKEQRKTHEENALTRAGQENELSIYHIGSHGTK